MSAARYLVTFLSTLAVLVALVMSTTYLVDPLQFFRLASYPPLWSSEQRHQAAGIARTLPFEAAVTGNSVMGTVSARSLGEALGMSATHLGLDGSTIFEQHRLLSLALAHRRLRVVVWGVSDFALTWPPPAEAVRSDLAPDPAHLYSANPLAWSRYLFDLTAFTGSLAVVGTHAVRLPGYRVLDPERLTAHPPSWTYGPESLRRSAARLEAACAERRAVVPAAPFRFRPHPFPEHVEQRMRWIRDLVRAHPATRFEIVLPPVHVSIHRFSILCGTNHLERVYVYDRLAAHLAGLPNVRLHDFRTAPVSFDDRQYYDAVHFSPAAAQEMIADIVVGRRVLAPEALAPASMTLLAAIRREVCERTPGVTCAAE